MKQPYIGITGFMIQEEVRSVLDILPENFNRLVMIGALVSRKTLQGGENKWPNRYPKKEKVEDIFIDHPRALNLVHYNTGDQATLFDQLVEVTELSPNIDGFQLNMTWPAPDELRRYREQYPNMKIVLQVGERAFMRVDHSPSFLLGRVMTNYLGLIDYLLLDPSGGQGKPMDASILQPYLETLAMAEETAKIDIGIGIAGGLGPKTMHLLAPLVKDFPDISIDAEGQLRDENDNLNLVAAKEYLVKAYEMLERK